MIKNYLFLLLATLVFRQSLFAQEKLLYSTTFQDWAAIASTTETIVNKTTDFSGENLAFTLFGTYVDPVTINTSRFTYPPATAGYMQTQKTYNAYITTSALKSITRIEFVEGATGSNRGYKVWKKNSTDADWVLLHSAPANPATGQTVSLNLNDSLVALKFTSVDIAQNSYMFSLKIWGNYVSPYAQMALTTNMNIEGAGTITRTPNSETYDKGSEVNLTATPNFGYKFINWTDSVGNVISSSNTFALTMDTAKKVTAVFQAINTYTFNLTISGSKWGEVKLTPAPTDGKYEEGTEVSMKVIPNAVTTFSYWDDFSTTTERLITVNSNKSFTATFDEVPFIVGWDFRNQTIKQNRAGDYYSETSNTGLISAYEPNGTSVGWLINTGAFSPSYPCVRFWTSGANFLTTRRYLQAQFSTVGYKNILVKSMVSANYQAYSKMTMQYSLNGTDFTKLDTVDITDVYNSGWKDLNDTLPADAEGQNMVYVRWIADATSSLLGNSTDNDGTAFTNIIVYADKVITIDTISPVLISSVPVDSSSTASINGSIVLTFNEKVKAGSGNITLGSSVISGTYGSKTATFKYERLSYDTEYRLIIPNGAITDISSNPFTGDTIIFRTGVRSEPVKKLFDAVVAKDGTGDYTSITDAIASAPTDRIAPWLIYIKNGKYTGHHDIPSTKPFIHLIGQSRDRVIISDNRLCGDAGDGSPVYHVSLGATMVVNSADCYFENITFENSWGYEKQAGPQALALYTLNNHITLKNCYLRSFQDTYLSTYSNVAYRHYLQNCQIEGAVDFIYGGGDVFFDNCQITCKRLEGGYIVAPSHQNGTAWGYVFSNCTIDGPTGVTTYYGRPWQNAPKTVFLNNILKINVYPVGWFFRMGAIPAVFADYGTMDANGDPVDLSQRISQYEYFVKDGSGNITDTVTGTAKNSLTDEEAATYTYENVILREGDSWNPRMMAEAPAKPINVNVTNKTVTWDNVSYSRLYIIFRDSNVTGFTINNEFTDTTAVTGQSYSYTIQAVSEYGALSEISEPYITTGIKNTDKHKSTYVYSLNNTAYINGVEPGSRLTVYNLSGKIIESKTAKSDIEEFNLPHGLYIIRSVSKNSQNVFKIVIK